MRLKRRSYRDHDDDEDAISDNLAAVNERLDDLTRHLERIAQSSSAGRSGATSAGEPVQDRVSEALARLDRRLDQVISEGRAASNEIERRARFAPPPAPPPAPAPAAPAPAAPARGPASWAAQISARQRALDGGAPATAAPPAMPTAPPPATAQATWGPGSDLAGLEQQLRDINTQISSLHQPYENGLSALRNDLAEIGRALTEAMPRREIEALEAELRALAERLDRTKQAGADGKALAALEHGLTEVRDALRGLTPAENLVGFEEAVRGLSHKIDEIAASAQATQDPVAFKQLEQAVVSLRGVVSNVASDGALAQLSAEVHALAAQFERTTADSSTEALAKFEARIAALMESGRAVPPELEGSIRALSERLDRMQLSQGDQLALGALEDRIAKLSEKLDSSDSRLNRLEAIERGLADLLIYLEEMRNGGPRDLRAAAPTEPETAAPSNASELSLASTLLDSIPQPSPPEPPMIQAPALAPEPPPPPPPPPPMPVAMAAPPTAEFRPPLPAKTRPRAQERPPIEPDLPPDTPLEPGSSVPRVRPGSAAARIAASEAALGSMKPMPAETAGKSAAIAAARIAARAAYRDAPAKEPKSPSDQKGRWFKWPSKKTPKAPPAPPVQRPKPAADDAADMPRSRGKSVLRFLKKLLIAASIAIIIIGAVQTAVELLQPDKSSAPPATNAPNSPPPATAPNRPMPTPQGALPTPPEAAPDTTGQIDNPSSFFDPSSIVTPKLTPKLPRAEVTGSIPRAPASPRASEPATHPASHSIADQLPAPIGPVLRAAVAANDPAAEYEVGTRYAEGRGFPRNLEEAVRWFERAANAGFAPAQFRLASLNEKGEGLKKDLQAARNLYLAAAGKGHAKAMHNLAVLYAEGIDGKPDYKVAAQWFYKAASYGVADSQYNLAILYARGIGVQANLAESYKWFALAAARGDADASRKRDEVGARLDRQTLMAAKLAAQTFVPEPEPEEATNVKVPPGGWDKAPAATAKPRQRIPASAAR